MTLAVLAPQSPAAPSPSKAEGSSLGVEADAIDLTRPWTHRPSVTGRAMLDGPGRLSWTVPEVALVDPSLRDRVRGWINRNGDPSSTLAPADSGGLAWSAVGLRVAHPERPHRLTVSVTGGHPASLGVALVAGGGPGGPGPSRPRRLRLGRSDPRRRQAVDVLVAGLARLRRPVLVLVNRNPSAPVQVGSIILTELVDLPPALPARESERSLGLHLGGLRSLDRFGGGGGDSGRVDTLAQARNLSTYLAHCGPRSWSCPKPERPESPEGLGRPGGRGLHRPRPARPHAPGPGPSRRRGLGRRRVRHSAGLPAPESPEAGAEGLVRVDRRGVLDGPSYQPIHPRVREAMARKVAEAVALRKARPNLLGVLIRLGPGSTLPGGPDTGLDDPDVREVSSPRRSSGLGEPGPRAGFGRPRPGSRPAPITSRPPAGSPGWPGGPAKSPFDLRRAGQGPPDSKRRARSLAVVTPGLEPGPSGDEARRVDLSGLGRAGLARGGARPGRMPTGEGAPMLFRGAGLSTDDLGHDLATSPELDDLVAARPSRGALLGVEAIDPESRLRQADRPPLTARPDDRRPLRRTSPSATPWPRSTPDRS